MKSEVADATTFVINQILAEETLDTEEEDLPDFFLRSAYIGMSRSSTDLKQKTGSSSSVSKVTSARS